MFLQFQLHFLQLSSCYFFCLIPTGVSPLAPACLEACVQPKVGSEDAAEPTSMSLHGTRSTRTLAWREPGLHLADATWVPFVACPRLGESEVELRPFWLLESLVAIRHEFCPPRNIHAYQVGQLSSCKVWVLQLRSPYPIR